MYILLYFIVLINFNVCFLKSDSFNHNEDKNDTINIKCKVKYIKKSCSKNAFLIYVEKLENTDNNKNLVVISLNYKKFLLYKDRIRCINKYLKKKGEKIKKGKVYNFILIKEINNENKVLKNNWIVINGVPICVDIEDCICDIAISCNLKGLYYFNYDEINCNANWWYYFE